MTCSSLTLTVRERRPDHGRYAWHPFEPNAGFEPSWWNEPRFEGDSFEYLSFHLDRAEVARVALGDDADTSDYPGALRLASDALEIQFIEVSATYRYRGIGTAVVDLLCRTYPDRPLLAFSEAATQFWTSVGWHRYDHPSGSTVHRPLFVRLPEMSGIAETL